MNIGNKFKAASNVVTSKAGRSLLKTQKHSPTLLFGAGVVGVVATTVLASKATLKLDDLLEENEVQVTAASMMNERARLDDLAPGQTYTDREYKKDLTVLKVRLCKDIARLYAPAIGVGMLSIGALTGSHVILNNRYTGAVAAYSALEKATQQYRGRVTEALGVEKERELYFGTEEREVPSEDGKRVDTVTAIKSDGGKYSQYAKLFSSETSQSWEPRPEYNLMFLRAQQNWANDTLRAKGHLFLNEVYDNLGLERTKAGAVTGWVKDNPNGGDNFVDFGIFNGDNLGTFIDFFQGTEGGIYLDFNVDGVVYDLI